MKSYERYLTTSKTCRGVTVYTSTSGRGYHVYVYLKNSPLVSTHTHHAALARSVLSKLAALTGFNISEKVDVCGGNMWIWKRGCTGFQVLKEHREALDCKELCDWEEHLTKVKSKRGKRSVGIKHDSWAELNKSIRRIELDPGHRRLIKWLEDHDRMWWWDTDHWMLVCHTADLKEAHEQLSLRGIFETVSSGKDKGADQNCFAFPLSDSSWVIRRHTPGISEHDSWRTDRSGWTYCYYNRVPTVPIAASLYGIEAKSDTYHFKTLRECLKSLELLNIRPEFVPDERFYLERPATIKDVSSTKILVQWQRVDADPDQPGWHANKKLWERIFEVTRQPDDAFPADNLIRHVSAQNKELGWYANARGKWIETTMTSAGNVLTSQGIKRPMVPTILGECVLQSWHLVNQPFESEYPGNRQWNKYAPQLAFDPRPGDHPTWDKILNHIARNLSPENSPWCIENGIDTGARYLLMWIAALFQEPLQPLPYLFMYGPQNSGKSILHEALRLLLVNGHGLARADLALTNQGDFNGEIEGAVLCVVEETNLQQSKKAYEKIKDWVTSPTITIRALYRPAYDTVNCTHWIQCANDASYCPIFPGDTRIVVVHVPPLFEIIPKNKLLVQLKDEAPSFLATLLDTTIPETADRLRIPVVNTPEKEMQQELNEDALTSFCRHNIVEVDGETISFREFYNKFGSTLTQRDKGFWTTRRVALKVPYVRGKMGEFNEVHLGNVAWESKPATTPYVRNDKGRLVKSYSIKAAGEQTKRLCSPAGWKGASVY
jgi:hypothetical protein